VSFAPSAHYLADRRAQNLVVVSVLISAVILHLQWLFADRAKRKISHWATRFQVFNLRLHNSTVTANLDGHRNTERPNIIWKKINMIIDDAKWDDTDSIFTGKKPLLVALSRILREGEKEASVMIELGG
jgi:hypothetical protein